MIRVSTSNFYVGNPRPEQAARLLASLGCTISGVQEGHSGNAEAIRRGLPKTHEVWWKRVDNKDDYLGFRDVPVVYPKTLNVKKRWARQISKRSQKNNIGMPRAATAVRFKHLGRWYTFINTHTNAAVQGPQGNPLSPKKYRRVAEYIKGMMVLELMIGHAHRRGDLVILVGDLNFAPVKHGIWKFSPQAMFKRNGMEFINHRIDYVAYSKELAPHHKEEIPTSKTGSDHPWLVVDLHLEHRKG